MTSGVYQIRNTVNGKCYVGSSKNLKSRWTNHKWCLQKRVHRNSMLQRVFNKYGLVFEFSVLETCEVDDLIAREQYWIDALRVIETGYNLVPVAGSTVGRVMSEETRKKMERVWALPKDRMGYVVSEETKEKLRAFNRGHKLSETTIAKRSATTVANNLLRPKRVASEESRAKMRAAKVGRAIPEATRAKMSAALTGRVFSTEHRENLRKAATGRVMSPESIAKSSKRG